MQKKSGEKNFFDHWQNSLACRQARPEKKAGAFFGAS